MTDLDVREAVIRCQIVTSENDKLNADIKQKIQESSVQKNDFIYPYFKADFQTYDPYPRESCIDELQKGIQETIFNHDKMDKIVHEYSPNDVLSTVPIGENETEFVRVGESFVDPNGKSSLVNINLEVFEDILGS